MKSAIALALVALASPALASTKLYVHTLSENAPKWTSLATDPRTCGAQIVLPWRPIDNGSGVYDWSSVEAAIRPWASHGKKVALTFVGVDEKLSFEFSGNTSVLATPDYVMKSVDVVTCPNLPDNPPTPVFWEPGYALNWQKFIAAAITRYQSDPRIAYFRFGIGVGGEDYVGNNISQDPVCIAAWQAKGMSYKTWLSYSKQVVKYIGGLHPTKRVTFPLNDEHVFDPTPFATATALAPVEAQYGFVGNAGYYLAWDPIYETFAPRTWAQQASDHLSTQTFGPLLQDAKDVGVTIYEIYGSDFTSQEGSAAIGATFGTDYICQ